MSVNVGLKGEKVFAEIDSVKSQGITSEQGEATIINQPAGKKASVYSEAFPNIKVEVTVKANDSVTAEVNVTSEATITAPVKVTKKDGVTPMSGVVVDWGRKGKKLKSSVPTGADGKTSVVGCLPGAEADNTLSCLVAGKTYPKNVEIKTGMPEVVIITDVEGETGTILVKMFIVIDGVKIEL